MASPRPSNAPQFSGGGGSPAMLSSGARVNPSNGNGMPLPPGAHFIKIPPPFSRVGGATGLMGPPVAAAPPDLRPMVSPGQMFAMVGNRKVFMPPPPPSLPVSGGSNPPATGPSLSRSTSPGTMASQPGPAGPRPAGPRPQPPQFAFVQGKKIMVPPGTKLPMGNPGPSPATSLRAPPQTAMDGKVRMMPPEQSWAASPRSSLAASPPPGATVGRGAGAGAGGVGGSPLPLHRNLGESPVQPLRQATALPSPPPHPTIAAAAGTTDKKSSKSSPLQSLTRALNFLKNSLWEEKDKEKRQPRNAAAPQQQPQRMQTPPGLAVRGESGGSGPTGPNTLIPSGHSSPSPSGQPPQKKQHTAYPPQSMSGGGAAAAGSRMRMPPGQAMAIKGPLGVGRVAMETKKVITGPPPPDAVRSRAGGLERPPLGASRSGSAAAVSLSGTQLASLPPQWLQHPYSAGPRLVKRIVGPPPPHAQLIPAPSQQHSRSGSESPPLLVGPPPAAVAAANLLRVPSATVLKEEQLPEAGVRSPGHRGRQLGESSDESDGAGKDNGSRASAQGATPSHIHIVGHLRESSSADGATGSDRAQRSHTTQHDAALQAKDSALPPEPMDHSQDRGGGDDNDDTRRSTGAVTSGPPANDAAAATTSSPSTAGCDSNRKTSASTTLRPVRQTVTTAARSAAAATKRQEEEEKRRLLEAAYKDSSGSKKVRKGRSKSAPHTAHASRPQSTPAARGSREPPSPQEEDNTQKPSSVEPSYCSIASTLSRRTLRTPSDTSTSPLGEAKCTRSPTRGRGGARDENFSAPPGSDSTRSWKRKGKVSHTRPSAAQGSEQPARQLHRSRSQLRSRKRTSRRRTSEGGKGDGNRDNSDAEDEEDAESGFEKLTSRDLYRLAKVLRDSSVGTMGAGIDGRLRRGSRQRSYHSPDNSSDRVADADSGDDDSWGRQRQQHNNGERRSTLPITTVGIPWRYVGARRSVEPFASPPPVRRPLGYIDFGGGRYARVGGSPYARRRSQPHAMSIRALPLGATDARKWVSNAEGSRSYSPLPVEQSPGPSAPVDVRQNAVTAEVQTSAVMDSQQGLPARGDSNGATAAYYSGRQRQLVGHHGSLLPCRTFGGGSAAGGGSDDTMSSAADSQHPYCVSASALAHVTQSISPLSRSIMAAHEPCKQQRGRSSSLPGALRWAHLQPPPPEAVAPALSTQLSGGAQSGGLSSHLRTSSLSNQQQQRQQQRQAQGYTRRSYSCTAVNNLRRASGKAAADAAATARGGSHTYSKSDTDWSPPRKEAVYLSKATIARLSTPQQRRGSPISRRSHGGGDGNSSVTAPMCSEWLDEILASTTVTSTGVRTHRRGVAGSGEKAVAAVNAIHVVDLRREFKPRTTDGHGCPGSIHPASPSQLDEKAKDYSQEFTGSRARPHVPGVSFKHMIGARSATSSPLRTNGTALATGGGAVNVKTANGVSEGLPFPAYSSIRIHDPMRKSPWALAPEREGLDVLPGRPALSRRRRIPVDESAATEIGANDPLGGGHYTEDSNGTGGVQDRARGATRIIVEEVHLDEHRRPYLVVRPVPSSEEGKAQRAAIERLSRPKHVYRRIDESV